MIHLADFLCRRERIGDAGGERFPSLDPAALRTFGIHEEPKTAIKRIFGYGDELRAAMENAEAFSSIARGGEDETEAGVEEEAAADVPSGDPPEPSAGRPEPVDELGEVEATDSAGELTAPAEPHP